MSGILNAAKSVVEGGLNVAKEGVDAIQGGFRAAAGVVDTAGQLVDFNGFSNITKQIVNELINLGFSEKEIIELLNQGYKLEDILQNAQTQNADTQGTSSNELASFGEAVTAAASVAKFAAFFA